MNRSGESRGAGRPSASRSEALLRTILDNGPLAFARLSGAGGRRRGHDAGRSPRCSRPTTSACSPPPPTCGKEPRLSWRSESPSFEGVGHVSPNPNCISSSLPIFSAMPWQAVLVAGAALVLGCGERDRLSSRSTPPATASDRSPSITRPNGAIPWSTRVSLSCWEGTPSIPTEWIRSSSPCRAAGAILHSMRAAAESVRFAHQLPTAESRGAPFRARSSRWTSWAIRQNRGRGRSESTSLVRLRRLVARGFRNLDDLDREPPPKAVALLGANAQGKTNLLEAIYYPVLFRSFRGAPIWMSRGSAAPASMSRSTTWRQRGRHGRSPPLSRRPAGENASLIDDEDLAANRRRGRCMARGGVSSGRCRPRVGPGSGSAAISRPDALAGRPGLPPRRSPLSGSAGAAEQRAAPRPTRTRRCLQRSARRCRCRGGRRAAALGRGSRRPFCRRVRLHWRAGPASCATVGSPSWPMPLHGPARSRRAAARPGPRNDDDRAAPRRSGPRDRWRGASRVRLDRPAAERRDGAQAARDGHAARGAGHRAGAPSRRRFRRARSAIGSDGWRGGCSATRSGRCSSPRRGGTSCRRSWSCRCGLRDGRTM